MRTLTIIDSPTLFRPNPGGQSGFLDDYAHRYCALAGGWFAGKTWAGARKLANLHVLNAFDDAGTPTGVKSAVIAPTYQLAMDFDVPELKKAFKEMGLAYRFCADPKRFYFEMTDLGTADEPSLILVRTADAPERITGWTAGAVWGDEAARWKGEASDPQRDPFLQADGRLRDPRARFLQFMLTFTHEGDATRVFRDFESDASPDHALYRAGSAQNPHASEFVKVQRRQLGADLAAQYLDGIAMSLGGQHVYSSFESGRHLDETLALDPALPVQVAIDFNIDPGMHCVVGQFFGATQRLSAVHEIHEPRMDVRRMVLALANLLAGGDLWNWPGPLEVYGDASGSSKWAGTGQSCYDVLAGALAEAGVPFALKVARRNPSVMDRVNAVNCALSGFDGTVRYTIHPRCKRLVEDYRRMKWTTAGDVDKSDHALTHASDADGYRVHRLLPIRRTRATAEASAVL